MKEIQCRFDHAACGWRAVWAAGVMAVWPALAVLAADEIPAGASPVNTNASAAEQKPAIDAKAATLLRRMSECLAQARQFSVNAEIWQDIQLCSGQQVQAGRTIDLQVRRPNRLHTEVRSTRRNRAMFYDGTSLTLLNRVQAFYGTIPAPGTLDETLDVASEHFGITLPLEDLIVSDPYQSAMRKVTSGSYLGSVTVLGVPCEHLVFSQDKVDWQVWIEQGAVPVPRKIVITYKDEEGAPEYTAIFSHWDLQTPLPDFLFTFEPPAGASPIDVAEIKSKHQMHAKEGK